MEHTQQPAVQHHKMSVVPDHVNQALNQTKTEIPVVHLALQESFRLAMGLTCVAPAQPTPTAQLISVKQHPVKAARIALPRALRHKALLQRLVAYLVHPEQLHLMASTVLHAQQEL